MMALAAAAGAQDGRAVYAKNCQVCHQPTGAGLPGAFPPLAGSEWVTGSPETLARILLDGLQGPVQVAGVRYDNVMPGWRQRLSDGEIAAVAGFIRGLEPNSAGPVDVSVVAAARAAGSPAGKPWTADALRAAERGDALPELLIGTTSTPPRHRHHGHARGSSDGRASGRHGWCARASGGAWPNGRRRS